MSQPHRSARCFTVEERGMSLLELMIASGVMILTFVMVFGAIVSVANATRANESKALSIGYLSAIMEDIHSLSFDELMAYTPPDLPGMGPRCEVTVSVFDGSGNPVDLPLSPGSPEITIRLPNIVGGGGVTVPLPISLLGGSGGSGSGGSAPPPLREVRVRIDWEDDTGRVSSTEGWILHGN